MTSSALFIPSAPKISATFLSLFFFHDILSPIPTGYRESNSVQFTKSTSVAMGVQQFLAATMCVSALIAPTLATIYWAGIDESGGEFAPGVLPGTFGVDYAFTNNSAVDIYVKESKVFLPSSNYIEKTESSC